MVDMEVIVERKCEGCGRFTRQLVEWDNWFRITTTCLEWLDVEDGQDQCGEVHIFTLSHLQSGSELTRPFTRTDLGIVVTGRS
jgi:hypothetical protein